MITKMKSWSNIIEIPGCILEIILKRFFCFVLFFTLELTPYRFYILATCSYIPATYKGQNMVKITKFPPLSMPRFST